ncbi:MAG TPA: NTF2-like N-terminal transpeptidase domain-containing protein [Chloroflexia bacterium]|nr:NTF2-like N-terminal transpeptidase domain-containing protein [Chloroflexia bacterium]
MQRQPLFKPVKKLFLAGLLCLLPLLLTACADNTPPGDVARHYLDDMNSSSFSAAYDLLTADSQLKVSRSQYEDRLKRARQDAGIVKSEVVQVKEPSIAGKRASVPYQLEVTLQNGQKLSLFESMVLLQQEGGWRVIWPPQ